MGDFEFFLASSTKAIAGSADAVHLIEQKERLEQAVVINDPPLVLDTAKAFLETIFKTILADKIENPIYKQDMNSLYRDVRDVLPLNHNPKACQILKKLTNSIVYNINELRNHFGAASHGDDGYFENPITISEAEMVAQLADGLVGYLYKKHKENSDPKLSARIYYHDYPEFNDFLDGQYESYNMPLGPGRSLNLAPSMVLFSVDEKMYREMLLQYLSTEEEDREE